MSYKIESPLPVIEGGTGKQNFVPYSVICGGTGGGPTTDDDLQSVVSIGSLGYVLTSNGPGVLPTFQNVSAPGAISTIDADTGSVNPVSGVINVLAGILTQHCGSSVSFDGLTDTLELNVTDASNNTIIGENSGNGLMTGFDNVALGSGNYTLITSGEGNIAIGINSCQSLLTGENNIVMGFGAGSSYIGAESSNILLNSVGLTGESNVLRIGNATGTGPGELTGVAICGIAGSNVGSVATVVTEANDQLGTAVLTAGTGITITPGANTITIDASSAVGITDITGDLGGAQTGPSISIEASSTAGATVDFSGTANVLSLNVTDANSNTIIGLNAGNFTIAGDNNTALGETSGQDLTVGTDNTLIGFDSGASLTSGSFNILLGSEAGSSYTSSESSNVILNASGTIADSHTLRIGSATGTGNGELNKAFICGIDGINVGSVATVVTESGNQLGTAVLTAGTNITITPGANTITIDATGGGGGITDIAGDSGGAQSGPSIILNANTTAGSSVSFSGSTNTISLNVTDSNYNTIIGNLSGNGTMSGQFNVSLGRGNISSLTTGGGNIVVGNGGDAITDGSRNIILGTSGFNYTGSESDNILLGNNISGIGTEINILRIGNTTGGGNGGIQNSFIQGIRGVTTTNNDAVAVLIDSAGQLGTVSSSARVKHNIQDMDNDSSDIYKLRPVTFAYNSDASEKKQYGLIAEEVHEVMPNIVVYDKEGLPETVQYQNLPAMLLNEIQKLAARVAELEAR